MERLPGELIYFLIFLAIVAYNILSQRAARRRQQEEKQAQPEPPPAEDEPLEDIWGRVPAPPVPPAAPVAVARAAPPRIAVQTPAPPSVHPVRVLLRDRRDLRRAVALMIVLGPCRGQDPPER